MLKGDNNKLVDSYHTSSADLVGLEPRVGTVLGWAHQPFHAALIIGVLALLGGLRRRRKEEKDVKNGAGTKGALLACGGAVVLFALLTVIAFTIGVTKLRVGVLPARIAALMGLALALAGMGLLLTRRRRSQEKPVGAEVHQAAFVLREGGIAYRYMRRLETQR